jgi:hypothetical protein
MTNAEFQKTIAMICGLDYATPTKEQSAAIEEMEKIIQEWKKEFERTSGIQAVVTNNNSGQYKVIYEDAFDEFKISYYDKELFTSAIATLKTLPSFAIA